VGYTVGSSGVVTFHAGGTIKIGNDFQVSSGGSFTARVDY